MLAVSGRAGRRLGHHRERRRRWRIVRSITWFEKKKKHICRQVANKIKTNRYTWIICINTRVRKRLPSPFPIIVIENRLGQFIFHSIQWLLATEMCSKWNKREREIRFDQVPCWLRDSNHSESFINRLTPLRVSRWFDPRAGIDATEWGFSLPTPYVFQWLQFWVLYKKMKNNWALLTQPLEENPFLVYVNLVRNANLFLSLSIEIKRMI